MSSEPDISDLLSDFARTMLTDFPIQSILDELVHRIVDVLPITSAGVTMISPGTKPEYVAASNAEALLFEQLQTEFGEGPCVEAYRTGGPVAVPDLRMEARFPTFGPRAVAAGLAAVFTFPLRHGDAQLGALDLYRGVPGPLDAATMTAAQTLADVAAAYVLNAQARAGLQEASDRSRRSSLHDALTDLPNRLLLLERLDHALVRSRRSGSMTALFYLDLDQFKRVNDANGHQVGDELLLAIATRLSSRLRACDTVARMSGDEFVVVCEDLDGGCEAIAARIGATFDEPFALSIGDVHMTASIGVTLVGSTDQPPEELLHIADMAMYEAKRDGGDGCRIVGVSRPPAPKRSGGRQAPVASPAADQDAFAPAAEAHEVSVLEGQLAVERDRNQRLRILLRNLADHDPVTDLLNRRGIEVKLTDHLIHCGRYGPEGAFLLVGLDGLEEVASAVGQSESDEVLAAVAEAVVHRLRASDVAGRWGPGELAVLLPKEQIIGVSVVADALVGIVRGTGTARVPPGSLSAGIGVALAAAAPDGPDQLVAEATRSMVAARNRGACWVMAER